MILTAATQANLGYVYAKLGMLDDASMHLENALQILKTRVNNDNVDLAKIYKNLSIVYKMQQKNDTAQQYFSQATLIFSKKLDGKKYLDETDTILGQPSFFRPTVRGKGTLRFN